MWNTQGFDFCDPALTGWVNTSGLSRSTSVKRNGTHSLSVAISNAQYQYFPLGANYATVYMGFAFRVDSLAARLRLCSFHDNATYQISLTVETDGSLRIFRNIAGKFDGIGSATSLQQTAAGQITAGAWHHISVKITFHGSSGVYEVRLNTTSGSPNVVLSGSGVNTSASGNAYANRIGLGDVVPNTGQYFDDFWVNDIGYQGDCAVETSYVSANGVTNNFNVSGAAANYQAVDDPNAPDDDTTYTYSPNVGDLDIYDLANLSRSVGTVKGFRVSAVLRKDDTATKEVALVVRSNSTNSIRSTQALTQTYAVYAESFTADPVTSAAPTIAGQNALQVGVKVIT